MNDTAAAASSGSLLSPISTLAAAASSLVEKGAKATIGWLLPSSGPVGDAATQAVEATGAGAKNLEEATAKTLNAAGTGVKVGFGAAVFLLVVLSVFYVLSFLPKARR